MLRFGKRLTISVAILLAIAGFYFTYGSTPAFLGCLTLFSIAGFFLRRHCRRVSIFLCILTVSGLLLWPIDAVLRFPILRTFFSWVPFSPEISVFPEPSGNCVAYLYNYSFLDSAYEVRFAHGLEFPGNAQWVPLGNLVDTKIEPKWLDHIFVVEVPGIGDTLVYDASTGAVTFPLKKNR